MVTTLLGNPGIRRGTLTYVTDTNEINSVGVVGLGTMGAGIAEVFAKAGIKVTGVEAEQAAVTRGRDTIDKSLDKQVSRGRLDATQRDAVAAALTVTTDFDALADVDLVIEAVPERMEIKRELFTRLDKVCRPSTILATNTSSLSVTDIAQTTMRGAKVIGMHFFNPAPVMKLVEVISTVHTDPGVVDRVIALAQRLGKTVVAVGDNPGFVVNRLLLGYLNHAAKLLDANKATVEDIDAAMRTTGLPMGPLQLADVIGLDTCVEILDVIHRDSNAPRHEVANVLRDLVAQGKVGKKSGHGFYDHTQALPKAEPEIERVQAVIDELVHPHVAEAVSMADSGYASREDIDTAMKLGCGYPEGIFALIQ